LICGTRFGGDYDIKMNDSQIAAAKLARNQYAFFSIHASHSFLPCALIPSHE